jgi:hypothetical protein
VKDKIKSKKREKIENLDKDATMEDEYTLKLVKRMRKLQGNDDA